MGYTVKLAVFPPWKAPIPYETLAPVFDTGPEAAAAGAAALAPITERELASVLQPRSAGAEGGSILAVTVPDCPVHGYLILDENGVEVGNWTTLDVALERADEAKACSSGITDRDPRAG